MRSSGICLLIFLSNIVFAQSGKPLRYISLENTVINGNGQLTENGITYPTAVSGNPSLAQLSKDAYSGNNSLLFNTPAGSSTQRFEYKLCDYDLTDALTFNNERYAGFALKIPDEFDNLEASVIFFQAWQGFPWGPPIMLKLTSGENPFKIRLTIRNSATGPNSSDPDQELWNGTVYKNNWYTFVIGMKPRLSGDSSRIQLWMNGNKVVDWNNKGNVGYFANNFETDKPYSNLCLKFGIYQPGSNTKHSLLFDEIRLAENFESANPTKKVTSKIGSEAGSTVRTILLQNNPNPFNPETEITYQISETNHIFLEVYDLLGRKVSTLVDEIKQPGTYVSKFSSDQVSSSFHQRLVSGVYFYVLKCGNEFQIKKMLLLK